jgi:DNA repair exonuclease SbcCD ATPase subunit
MDYEVHSKALKDAQLRYEIAKNTVGQSITALLKDRDRVVQQLNEQVSTYRVLQDKLNTLSNAILHGEMHKRCKDEYRALCEEFESTCKVLLDNQACEYYRSIISLVTEEKNRYTIRLRELEQILQEQNNLQNQLDTLVLPTLKELEDKLTDYTSVEAALSPTTGIPHAYTLQYLNQIISLVNLFLDKVWTYDMRLYELDINKPIDFRFKINIKGYQVPDISICSDGQRAMIDLAFCLALMAHMGILDQYPIYFDELDASLDRQHRFKMMELMNELVEHKDINQLFLIHHTNMDGFSNCSTLCLSTENITVPAVYNEHVEIDKMG